MKTITKLARLQRKSKNPWEHKIWQELRAHRFYNVQFKRQVPIGNYLADFCCRSRMLIIELDGGQHLGIDIAKKDKVKQRYFESLGFKVLRFWNNDLTENLEGVLEEIRRNLQPLPKPLP